MYYNVIYTVYPLLYLLCFICVFIFVLWFLPFVRLPECILGGFFVQFFPVETGGLGGVKWGAWFDDTPFFAYSVGMWGKVVESVAICLLF